MQHNIFSDSSPSLVRIDISPLVNAIASNDAVAFVGAGASISAGLPGWQTFLSKCLKRARKSTPHKSKWNFAEQLLERGEYLIAAELLQRGIGTQLERYIWDEFGYATQPSAVHEAIARLPFSAAITTNYDRLLEAAYSIQPGVRTWKDAPAIFSSLRHKRFCVIKTHGDVGNRPSLVLTKSDYRAIASENAFNSCLKMFLTLRTFLFVGYSLRDHDLLHLLDDARLMHGEDFGPHYSILFDDEVDSDFVSFLADSYAIQTIICKLPEGCCKLDCNLRRNAIVDVLREIHGRVAKTMIDNMPQSKSTTGTLFSFDADLRNHLADAVEITGSFRGDICMVHDNHIRSMTRIAMHPEINEYLDSASDSNYDESHGTSMTPRIGDSISHDSVIGRVFLTTWLNKEDFAYISDVSKSTHELSKQGFTDISYQCCHPDVLCELACPILADGYRVGVINIEADRPRAYTQDHLYVLQKTASRIGASHIQLKHRELVTRSLQRYYKNISYFNSFMCKSRLLASL